MSDKEFDNLFKDKFEEAEIEPSTNLWANIEAQLEPKKKKRIIPIYWMAAASVAVAITAMLVFQKEDVIKLHGQDQLAVVVPATSQTDAVGTVENVTPTTSIAADAQTNKKADVSIAKDEAIKTTADEAQKNNLKNTQEGMQPNAMIASLDIKKADPIKVKVGDEKDPIIDNQVTFANNPAPKPVGEPEVIDESTPERKGIRNVGDLVNFVVDKVDKRDKKLLKFKTDEDDESSLIGINIGFLKLNAKKHK